MDSSLQSEISVALVQADGEEQRRTSIDDLKETHPHEAGRIEAVYSCYTQKLDATACLEEVISGLKKPPPLSSGPGHQTYQEMVELGDKAVAEMWDRTEFLVEALKIERASFSELPPEQRERINEVVVYYSYQLRNTTLEEIGAILSAHEEFGPRYNAHQFSGNPETLSPLLPPYSINWDRHELVVPDLPYSIPVFLPKGKCYAWPIFEQHLLSAFEILKVILTPDDIKKILNPGNLKSDFSIKISGTFDTSFLGGEYTAPMNRVVVSGKGIRIDFRYPDDDVFQATPFELIQAFNGNQFISTFFHEFGHAIYYCLLSGKNKTDLDSFFGWSFSQIIDNPFQRYNAQRLSHSLNWNGLQRIIKKQQNDGDYRDYLPAKGFYSLSAETEFFPEFFNEYVYWMIGNVGEEGPRIRGDMHRVRTQIMDDMFDEDGIDSEALSRKSVEEKLVEAGEDTEHDFRWRYRTIPNLTFPLVVGHEKFMMSTDSVSLSTSGPFLGTRIGHSTGERYMKPTVSYGGEFDWFSAPVEINNAGLTERVHVFDMGVWFQANIPMGPVAFFMASATGVRIVNFDNSNYSSLWIGMHLGAGILGGSTSLTFQPKFTIQDKGGESSAVGVHCDIPALTRYLSKYF